MSARTVMKALGHLSTLLYIVTKVFINTQTLSEKRLVQITTFFQMEGFALIKNLRLLFQKCALEEMYISRDLPDDVRVNTMPEPFGNVPPIQIYVEKPIKERKFEKKTSTKFKNTFEVRRLTNNLQTYTSIIFRCFLKLGEGKSIDPVLHDLKTETHIFDEVVTEVLELRNAVHLMDNLAYSLVLLNFNSYIFTCPKTAVMPSDLLQTLPAVIFYQKGGYQFYADFVIDLFSKMTEIKDLTLMENIDYVKDSEEVLTLSCLINALTFLNRSMQKELMTNINSLLKYYSISSENDINLVENLIFRIKLLSLKMITELDQQHSLFGSISKSVPYSVFKQFLTMLKNSFKGDYSSSCYLYKIKWQDIIEKYKRYKILLEIGMKEDDAKLCLEINCGDFPDRDFEYLLPGQYESLERLVPDLQSKSRPTLECVDDIETRELNELRLKFYNDSLPQKIFNVLPFYPKLVNAFARMLLQLFECYSETGSKFAKNILLKIQETDIADSDTLSSYIHLLGIFLNENKIYEQSEDLIVLFLNYLVQYLKPEHINTPWFSKALFVYEIILTKSELPTFEKIGSFVKLALDPETPTPIYKIPEIITERVFDTLVRVSEITNFYSALAECRILLIYARNEEYANEIARSGIFNKLLKVIGSYQKSDKINFLESSFLLLARRCFETTDIVTELIRYEINRS